MGIMMRNYTFADDLSQNYVFVSVNIMLMNIH
jgi:hypothetical protein